MFPLSSKILTAFRLIWWWKYSFLRYDKILRKTFALLIVSILQKFLRAGSIWLDLSSIYFWASSVWGMLPVTMTPLPGLSFLFQTLPSINNLPRVVIGDLNNDLKFSHVHYWYNWALCKCSSRLSRLTHQNSR